MSKIEITVEVDVNDLRLCVAGLAEAADLASHGFAVSQERDKEALSGIVGANAILARMLSNALAKGNDPNTAKLA